MYNILVDNFHDRVGRGMFVQNMNERRKNNIVLTTIDYGFSYIWSYKGAVSMLFFSHKEEEQCLKQPNQL